MFDHLINSAAISKTNRDTNSIIQDPMLFMKSVSYWTSKAAGKLGFKINIPIFIAGYPGPDE